MSQENTVIENVIEFLFKFWVWFFYVLIGMVGHFSIKGRRGNKFTWYEIFSGIGIALFVGFVSSAVCISEGWDGQIIVPVATLLSEKLVLALFAIDYKKIFSDFASYWSDKLKK